MKIVELKEYIKKYDNANKSVFIRKHFDEIEDIQNVIDIIKSDDKKLIIAYLCESIKICPVCGKYFFKQGKTCSKECGQKSRICTNIEKYGTENPLQNKVIQEKCRETHFKKYGVYNPSENPDVVQKRKNTFKERYGVESPFQSKEILEKRKNTCLERYGVTSYTKTDEYKQKVQETNIRKYGAPFLKQNLEIKKKSEETCLRKYGYKDYLSSTQKSKDQKKRSLNNLIQYFKENNLNYNDLTKEKIEEFLEEHNDRTFFNAEKCCEYFQISPYISNRIKRCFGLKYPNYFEHGKSIAENNLFQWIPTKDKLMNDRSIIDPLELDIVLPKIKLAIEYDGSYWHSFKDENYHLEKTKMCFEKGYQLFHIFEFDNIEIWKSMISNKLHLNKVIYARKCIIKELKYNQVKDFLDENHLQGTCLSKINLGLFYNDELVQVMTFSKPRFNKNYDYELLRLCSKKFINVVGGASKLFKYFTTKFKGSVISYANLRFSNGNIYRQLGFSELKISKPNYFYCKNDIVLTRYQCQKHKLQGLKDKGLIEDFKIELSELENLEMNGYFRLYDCGNIVFTYR